MQLSTWVRMWMVVQRSQWTLEHSRMELQPRGRRRAAEVWLRHMASWHAQASAHLRATLAWALPLLLLAAALPLAAAAASTHREGR